MIIVYINIIEDRTQLIRECWKPTITGESIMLNSNVLKVIRSPGKVCWHVKFNGIVIETAPTKREADVKAGKMNKIMNGWKI